MKSWTPGQIFWTFESAKFNIAFHPKECMKICIVWFQKISIPPPWRELEIQERRGVKGPGNSRGKGGWMINLVSRSPLIQHGFKCQSSFSKMLSYLLSRTFIWKNSGLNTCIWIALYLKYIFFLQKSLLKLTNAKNVPLRGNGHHYMLPVHKESPFRPKNTGE